MCCLTLWIWLSSICMITHSVVIHILSWFRHLIASFVNFMINSLLFFKSWWTHCLLISATIFFRREEKRRGLQIHGGQLVNCNLPLTPQFCRYFVTVHFLHYLSMRATISFKREEKRREKKRNTNPRRPIWGKPHQLIVSFLRFFCCYFATEHFL